MGREKKWRILIVEDEDLIALCIKRYLGQLGYEVSAIVAKGDAAVDQARQNVPDLILMDITLNGKMNGIEASKQIRSFCNVPIVYITGHADIEQWQKAQITEPFGYIIKPFELRELEVVVAAAFYKFQKEEELFALSNSCHTYLENLRGVVLRSDLDFNPLFMHGPVEQIMGYKADEIMKGSPRLEELVHPEERPLYSAEDHEKLRALPNFTITKECRIVTRDNQVRWVRETVKSMPNQLGKPIMIEWVIHDITDYREVLCRLKEAKDDFKETHKQLLQLGKMAAIGQLAAGVAHEINNPIGFISNNMECLKQYVAEYLRVFKLVESLKNSVKEENMEKAKAAVQEITKLEEEINLDYIINDVNKLLEHTDKGLERVKKIVMDLRTFARRGNETMEMANVEEVLESIISIVWNEIKYKAELTKDYGKIPSIRCNAQAVGQVFINLLINAAQSIKDKGEIKVRTYRTNDHVCVAIADTGCGIAPQDMSKIFTPFFTTKEVGKGTGLGLSVSYDIIKRHGGDILIESQQGQGTIFTVQLPVNGQLASDVFLTPGVGNVP